MESQYLKIPKDRVAVLIGKNGETKKKIEARAKVKLDISKEGGVTMLSDDGLALWKTEKVVKAIGRGFNPNTAMRLLKDDYELIIINLDDMFHGRESDVKRVKGRIIGEGGKSRRIIEDLTGSKISVYGKTVGAITVAEDLPLVETALDMLIGGAQHASVYAVLEKMRRERKGGLR